MALSLASPCGVLSNEEDGMAVFESTAADIGGRLNGVTLPELSIISPGLEHRPSIREKTLGKPGVARQGNGDEGSTDRVRVFLRIRPLTEGEKERGEEQGCVCVQNEESLMLKAPKDSQNMKCAERGVAQSVHKFSFSRIFGPETTQQDFYESTMKEMVRDVLRGESRLLYTYGVTNSGKTYTVQGVGREAGLLPRALVSVFRKLQGRLYGAMDLKPALYQEVRQLDAGEVRAEEIRRDSLLKEEGGMTSRMRDGTSTWDSGIGGLSITSHIATQLEDSDSVLLEPDSLSHSGGEDLEEGVQFSVWVAFYEIYNEFLYDLLETPPSLQPKKRATLRLSDDKQGNPYVKDLTWVQVRSAEEAWRVLRAGRRNQSFASTHLNHNSSRSHSIFSTRILHVHPEADRGQATRVSELSVCDLAGSERCKEQRNGERMKEANNINTSLHTLGRCIAALRHNQNNKPRAPQVVPFRDCKLTRVLQGFFCGRGRSSMVVNINPCASTYDETLQALKFSAIATQLVHGPSTKTRVAYILSLLREPQPHSNDSTLMEEDEDSDGEEGDITMFDSDALLRAIEVLKREVQRQREEKEVLEATIREQVFSEMMEVICGMEKDFSQTLETERALLEERFEDKINNLQKSLRRYYNQEIEERDEQIVALTAALEKGGVALAEPAPLPLFPPMALGGVSEGPAPRRSQRLASTTTGELSRVRAELDQCRAELLEKKQELRLIQGQCTPPEPSDALTNTANRKLVEGQKNLRRLRLDLQKLGLNLQSGERACCRNTDGERLRHALAAADGTLAKQDQTLVELQNGLLLVKADLRRKAECLAQMQMPPSATPGSCKKRGCGAGAAAGNAENQPPEKKPFFLSLFPQRTPSRNKQGRREDQTTRYSRVLRSHLTPPSSPCPSGRYRVTKC
ncbi:kinesin-like protein KIF20A isoform X1 [Oncorhynchus mykiss]|uniref:Kinesin-like protein n=1 Tax=Oncorhynchus mykiss TaxID=8022 RepID=A0A8C7V7R3_ONCMY|nr:kinesin-like protein KIF20A isoform X1 [Oncorhynchus mykiss]XP_021474461.2 kinesin-like protein KIF20A isoform X1 [Oncorhynchus mykiss]XP_036846408.1 kinesin-like protein KIF20A isoform X1 [Oncorhynchus mykiss]